MDFDDLELVGKYGSWVRVQVAFYDFIFQKGTKLCATHWKQEGMKEIASGNFADGEDFYEKSVKSIENVFPTFEGAWAEFIESGK